MVSISELFPLLPTKCPALSWNGCLCFSAGVNYSRIFCSSFSLLLFQRLVKNLNQRKEGWVPVNSLQVILGDCRFRSARVAGILWWARLNSCRCAGAARRLLLLCILAWEKSRCCFFSRRSELSEKKQGGKGILSNCSPKVSTTTIQSVLSILLFGFLAFVFK